MVLQFDIFIDPCMIFLIMFKLHRKCDCVISVDVYGVTRQLCVQ